jgi:hypothetical protein|tara:strand:- start:345 stop:767 length:423 start_codon:yes stop_codon:yes gene_type:complete
MKYFKKIQETLLYYDFQPLLFFWVFSDILNNQVLWTSLSYWEVAGQPYTYWLYFSYLIISISMMVFIHNIKWLSRFVSVYLTLYLFSTIRYLVNIFNIEGEPFGVADFKNILITCFYAFMWCWILFKLKKEILHKDLNNE